MGRTLHYSITKDTGFTKPDQQSMIDISNKYNSGELADAWSLENYYFTPFNYYPNWKNKFKGVDPSTANEIVRKRFEELSDQSQVDQYHRLQEEEYIEFLHNPDSFKYDGFTKVQGNEYNAALVYSALLELSMKIPDAIIELRDEGEFMLCDVRIQNGKTAPKIMSMISGIQKWAAITADYSGYNFEGIDEQIVKDIKKEAYLLIASETLQKKLDRLREITQKLKDNYTGGFFCAENLDQSFFEPELFCRPVNPQDFIGEYEVAPGTLMAGFYGEYFGLSKKDAEEESYKAIGQVLGNFGGDGKVEILGEKKK